MMKRLISTTCCLFLVLFGCARREREQVTFAVGGAPFELDFWETLVAEFEAQSGIEVDLQRQPTDTDLRRQGLVIPLKSEKQDPDLFLMDVAWLAQFAASGWLEPLDALVAGGEVDLDHFFAGVVDLADRYEGALIALPVYVDGGLLYYREDLLREYGYTEPPQTWGDLVAYSRAIQEGVRRQNAGFYAFVWQGAQYEGLVCTFLEFAGSNNGGIVIEEHGIRLNSRENVEALHFMHDLIHDYRISPPNTFTEMKEEEVRTFFQLGNAVFERNWPYAWALHQEDGSGVQGRIGIAPLPHFESGESVATLGGWHVGLSRHSDAKPQSLELIAFIVSYATQRRLATHLGWNPGRRDIYLDPDVVQELPYLADLRGVFENARPRPQLPYYTRVSEVLQRYVSGALAGEMTPEEALERAEEEIGRVVERYGGGAGLGEQGRVDASAKE